MVHDRIIALCKEVDKFYRKELSLGNCAVFAMALHKFLGSDPGDHFEAIVINAEEKEFIEHVVLSHGGHCYDSYGECNLDDAIEDIIEDYTSDDMDVDEVNIYEYPVSEYRHLVNGTAPWTKLQDMIRSFQRAARRMTVTGEGMNTKGVEHLGYLDAVADDGRTYQFKDKDTGEVTIISGDRLKKAVICSTDSWKGFVGKWLQH